MRQIAVLAACARVVRAWPTGARIAFRDAVLLDVTGFSPGEWDVGEVLINAQIFRDRWDRGFPWPPPVSVLETRQPTPQAPDHDAIAAVSRLAQAIGLELACALHRTKEAP